MIIGFQRLQRLSGLERKAAIKRWLQKRAVAYLTDAKGYPFTTLAALNDRLLERAESNESLTERVVYANKWGTKKYPNGRP